MASTNKTQYFELSQYVATDKPTYLSDYNTDMDNIDDALHEIDVKAGTAQTKADSADGKADNAILTANSALTNAGTANTNIGVMANLDTTDKTSLVNAVNEVNDKFNSFNLNTFVTYTNDNFTKTGIASSSANLTVATNSDGSIFKVYGQVTAILSSNTNGSMSVQTNIRPTENITIYPAGMTFFENSSTQVAYAQRGCTFSVNTNGVLTIEIDRFGSDYSNELKRKIFMPCLYFAKDFGDEPIPNI